jgi:hypothetical protein
MSAKGFRGAGLFTGAAAAALMAWAPPASADSAAAEAEAPTVSQEVNDGEGLTAIDSPIQTSRRRPGQEADILAPAPIINPNAVSPVTWRDLINTCEPGASSGSFNDPMAPCAPAVMDRWRLAENLKLVKTRWTDPYNQNTLKGDRPIFDTKDWFFQLSAISDTVVEPRSFPIPVGVQSTTNSARNDLFGEPDSTVLAQTFILGAALIKGSTSFKPPDWEYRAALAFNINHVDVPELRVLDTRLNKGTDRLDLFVGLQELFVDKHLRNVSKRYDFDSLRVGVQPFSSDFRGFLFQDNQLGVRLFGNRDGNRWQYNLAGFARLEKDTNSGLNDITQRIRDDYVLFANAYRQDFPAPGLTSQVSITMNFNREADNIHIDNNGFPARPALIGDLRGREYDVAYLGYNADGRIGRLNLTASTYAAFGVDRNSIFTGKKADIRAFFAAVEPSYDLGWARVRGSALFASGDDEPYDDVEGGFDAIFENPQFAGADTSYWIRQTIPFIGGGRAVNVNGRNGVLNSLRSSKEEGQSNFNNPGTTLLGFGADFDVLPELRLSANTNHLSFVNTSSVEALRMQGGIDKSIGWDVSAAAIYRPSFIQNVVFRLSAAALMPGDGFKDIYANRDRRNEYRSILFNAVLSY